MPFVRLLYGVSITGVGSSVRTACTSSAVATMLSQEELRDG